MNRPLEMGTFIGTPARAQKLEGVAVSESTYHSGLLIEPHAHDAPLVSLVLGGNATEEHRGKTRELGAQSLLFTPAYETHSHRFLTPGRWLNIQFSNEWMTRLLAGNARLSDTPLLIRNHSALAWATRVGVEMRETDAVSRFAIEGALVLLVAELARVRESGDKHRPRWLHLVENAIEESIASPPSVEALAALAGVHVSHLLRTFRRFHGATVANYVRQRRITRARTEVANSTRPLSMIALDAGFADQSHFTREFKKIYGETPGQYARALRGRHIDTEG